MFISLAMLFTLVASFPQQTSAAGTTSFKDVTNHWAKSSILAAASMGLIGGYSDGTFKPNATITRAEFVEILARSMNISSENATPFTDMTTNWARDSVSAAVQAGIIVPSEYGQKFEPTKPITRLDVAKMVSRSLATKEDYQPYIELLGGLHDFDLPFTDYKEISDKDRPYVALAFGTGIIGGYADDSFGLNKTTNRAEATVMLLRLQNVKQSNPESFMALKELKSVAEHGTNFFAFENDKWEWKLEQDLTEKPITIDHYAYSGVVDRFYYVTPFRDYESIYERVYFKDRNNWTEDSSKWYKEFDGFLTARIKITPKKDQSRTTLMNSLWFSESFQPTVLDIDKLQDEKFGWYSVFTTKMTESWTLKKGVEYDWIVGAKVDSSDGWNAIRLAAEGAVRGSNSWVLYYDGK